MSRSTARRALPKRWAARPDQELPLMDGTAIPVVSMEAQVQAVLDGLTLQNRMGGVLTVQCERVPTEVPDERVTTFLLVSWAESLVALSRTRARVEAEDEGEGSVTPELTPEQEQDAIQQGADMDIDAEVAALAEVRGPSDENPDGFKYEKLEAEDIEGQPEAVR
jgi:hypothetical protein